MRFKFPEGFSLVEKITKSSGKKKKFEFECQGHGFGDDVVLVGGGFTKEAAMVNAVEAFLIQKSSDWAPVVNVVSEASKSTYYPYDKGQHCNVKLSSKGRNAGRHCVVIGIHELDEKGMPYYDVQFENKSTDIEAHCFLDPCK